MHDYAIDSRERVLVVRILFMASALLSGIAAVLVPSDLLPMRWLLPIPSIALVFGVSYWAFDNWLWRWRFLRVLRLISLPDLRGAWTGTIASSYTRFEKTQPVTVKIEQTWTKMVVRLAVQDEEDRRKGFHCLDPWDGNHNAFEEIVRFHLNDPGSMKTYSTKVPPGRYQYVDLTGPGTRFGESGQPWQGVDPTPKGRHWAVPSDIPEQFAKPLRYDQLTVQERLDVLDSLGLIHWPEHGFAPRFKRYLKADEGPPLGDVIDDITPISSHAEERVGFPTQKPLALYERIILASSNEGDVVLDPFCGCATTPIAAEKPKRQWLGIDQWRGAFNVVKQRMEDNRQLLVDVPEIYYSTAPPIRTDDGAEASPSLVLRVQVAEPSGPRMSHAEMKAFLIQQDATST